MVGEREELAIQVKERENDVDKLKQVIEEAKQDVKETKQELKQVEEKFMFVSFVMVLLVKMFWLKIAKILCTYISVTLSHFNYLKNTNNSIASVDLVHFFHNQIRNNVNT